MPGHKKFVRRFSASCRAACSMLFSPPGCTQFGVFEAHPASSVLHSVCAVGSACKFVACTRAGEVYEVARDRSVTGIVSRR